MNYSSIEINKIYNESCLETLSRIPDNFIDLVITSPPYNMNLRIRNGQYCSRQVVKEFSSKYDGFDDNIPIDEFYMLHKTILKELIRTTKLIFYNIQIVTGSKRAFFRIIGEFADNLKEIIIWDKINGQPAMSNGVLNRCTELILVFEQSTNAISRKFNQAKFNRGTLNDIWRIKKSKKICNNHAAVFPEELVNNILINFSNPNDIVYDPFMGTGTVAKVAKLTNRSYIGSEILEKYYKVSLERLNNI